MNTIKLNLFRGEKLKLALPLEEDFETMEKWGEDAEYLRNVDTEIALPKNKEQLAEEGKSSHTEIFFTLKTIQDNKLIGLICIHSIEWNNRTGLLAIGIGDSTNRGQGYGTEALRLILRYAFHEANLDRVGLEVIEYNIGGLKAYERVGFQLEGRKRSAVYRDGKRYDVLVMGILRNEWESHLI
ncbi:GNAT family N-acetyltransferase [Bacillus sp. AFS040349]|uniref:GNAT family N-acetyltransferase n=1 Tax=Bacillus sp. AFS040349 TaxID=2033502 RepID=UPI000BFD8BC1|nr:GNAT family protein [Bacillus sp. AFS040349]PGT83896.1 GNAT family N-acetyltransferase [Bacillus sp. AFS040349]